MISPWLGLLDRLGGRGDDAVVRFSIEVARREAWRFATELAASSEPDRQARIGVRDEVVAGLGRTVLHPGLLTPGLWLIRLRESRDVRRNLDVLRHVPAPTLEVVDARVDAGGR